MVLELKASPRLQVRPRRHRLEAQGLSISYRPLARLAQDEERRRTGSEARSRGRLGQMTATSPNFVLLDSTRPDIAVLVLAMLQARDAVGRRSWSHPQEPAGEEWWADVLAD